MRQLVILPQFDFHAVAQSIPILTLEAQADYPPEAHVILFSKAKTLLGQEFPSVLYDMRVKEGVCFNLEAFAIVAGTIQQHGTLYLLCPQFEQLEQQCDLDALRWNAKQAISCPNFYRYFKQLVANFGFPTRGQMSNKICKMEKTVISQLTVEQQYIADMLPSDPADIHLITAHRGRGKSTLCGFLANQLSEQYPVLVTAHSYATLSHFKKLISEGKIQFIAPDKLLQQIEQAEISPNQWFFIDEAASLPLPILQKLCHFFQKVILTTTTDNYEGTGQGFRLKLSTQLDRLSRHWALTQPLRWAENDPLERFIQQLLLLTEERPQHLPKTLSFYPDFYQLLALTHYKSTPTDLRRLFDAPNQQLYPFYEAEKLVAGGWLLYEGGLDEALTEAIWRGERRPQGNLVAQYLCFQGNLPQACRLRSLRISRLAVQPNKQQQGYGKRLVLQIISQIEPLVDFISVSFGFNKGLYRFWQQCGFQLVQITPTVEASSGLHSAMMLYPLSEQGKTFVQQAVDQFERDIPFLPFIAEFPFFTPHISFAQAKSYQCDEKDWQNLDGFIRHKRTFNACYASFVRFIHQFPEYSALLAPFFSSQPHCLTKADFIVLRQTLKFILSKVLKCE